MGRIYIIFYIPVMDKIYLILLFSLLFSNSLFAQKVQLKGCVFDKDNCPLVGATVILNRDSTRIAASTCDLKGTFVISTELLGLEVLYVSFVGFQSQQVAISDLMDRDNILIIMKEARIGLDNVTIKGTSISEDFAVKRLESIDIFLSPASSADPLKAISMLPTSTNVSESANVELRGSSGDRSIVMLNGVPIWKPVRNTQLNGMGNFSIFNTELIAQMKIYAGNPPLTIGNSIAGAVEIETSKKISFDAIKLSMSLANLGILVDKMISEKDFIQAYMNYQFSPLYLGLNEKNTRFLKTFNTVDCGINLHLSLAPRLEFNLYEYAIKECYEADTERYNYSSESQASSRRWFQVVNLSFLSSKKNWIFELNNGVDICHSGYKFGVMDCFMRETRLYTSITSKYYIGSFSFQSGVTNLYSRVRLKGSFPEYFFDYSDDASVVRESNYLSNNSFEGFLYCKYVPIRSLLFSAAIRKNMPTGKQPNYISWQTSGRWNITSDLSLLLSAGKYHAYNVPTYDSQYFTLHSSRQYSIDITSHVAGWDLLLSAYLKNENTQDYFTENGEKFQNKRAIEGIEISVSRSLGKFMLDGSYTFINSHFKTGGKRYSSSNDLNYIIRILLTYRTSNMWNVGLNFSAHPGLRYTSVKQSINILENVWLPLYDEYNSSKVHAYNSLDLTVNKIFMLKEKRLLSFLTITNVFNKVNNNYPVYNVDYSTIKYWENYQRRLIYMGLQLNF